MVLNCHKQLIFKRNIKFMSPRHWPALIRIFCLFNLSLVLLQAQDLPYFMHFSDNHDRLITGDRPSKNVFQEDEVHRFELTFPQTDYWTQLTNNYQSKKDIVAKLTIDGKTYDSVGVRFKGQTSYSRLGNSQKKSFNISMDRFRPSQDHQGYETFNLNNAYEDPSFLREITYLSFIKKHIPAARGAFAELYINGAYWGPYALVQGLNGDFIEEWFMNDLGTRWRAERSSGGGPGSGGDPFGAGKSSINYLGADTSLYKPNYTLKNTNKPNPWDDLMIAAAALNNPPLDQMYDTLRKVMDVDRALWFIASEILFGDDDSYINKGGMDYYIYWDEATKRLVPIEYDGNSVMEGTSTSWTPFHRETDAKFPLSSRLLKTPELRQRYIAHVRTLLKDYWEKDIYEGKLNAFYQLIDSFVQADTKKIYTYAQFQAGKTDLMNYIANRKNMYTNNAEIKVAACTMQHQVFYSNHIANRTPDPNQNVQVTIEANSNGSLNPAKVLLYYASGLDGYFDRTEMFDDGNHQDGSAGDNVFGGTIPGFKAGEYVRFYFECIGNNTANTASYFPEGAEHDVFIYRVNLENSLINDVVINEVMASNQTTVADQDGEFDDWIELYNKSGKEVDISSWYLSDNRDNYEKYKIPFGTKIPANAYLIVWADEDGKQNGYHANFKLSSTGENLYLLDSLVKIVDSMSFGNQETDKGFARVPNGTGKFVIQNPTFNKSNTPLKAINLTKEDLVVFPNPAKNKIYLRFKSFEQIQSVQLFSMDGKLQDIKTSDALVDISSLPPGAYQLHCVTDKTKYNKLIIKN